MKILLLSFVAIHGIFITTSAAEEWITLFDGKTLDGWKANALPDSFTVVDGSIRARASGDPTGRLRAHLFYTGQDGSDPERFCDFELEATVRGEPNSNSGIFIHTDMTTRDKALHLGKGYEIQLNNSPGEKRKTGSLYDVIDLKESAVDEIDWFTIRIKVLGKRITVHLNGDQVIDYTEPENPERSTKRAGRKLDPEGGGIALQAHDPQSVYYFKDIRVRRLDGE